MRAVVFHGVEDIRLDDVEEPKIQEPTDVIIRLTSSAICAPQSFGQQRGGTSTRL